MTDTHHLETLLDATGQDYRDPLPIRVLVTRTNDGDGDGVELGWATIQHAEVVMRGLDPVLEMVVIMDDQSTGPRLVERRSKRSLRLGDELADGLRTVVSPQ